MTNSIQLHIWPPADQLPSSSPYCVKVVKALEYKRLSHEVQVAKMGAPKWARRRLLPVAEFAGRKIEDSTFILKALDDVYPNTPRLYPLDPVLRADTLVLEEWADEWFALYVPFYRWTLNHNFKTFAAQAFDAIPLAARKLVVPLIRRGFVKTLRERWIGLDTEAERLAHFKDAISILEARLSKNAFLVLAQPTAADFAVYPILKMILNGKIAELSKFVEASIPVMGWLQRIETATQR